MTNGAAIELLNATRAELAAIHRPKDYSLWRSETVGRLGDALIEIAPFKDYANTWIFTGDGGYQITSGRFGEWAIDRLVSKATPEEIVASFEAEARRNASNYLEVSPIFGVQIDRGCWLAEGVELVPAADAPSWWGGVFMSHWQAYPIAISSNTCFLAQLFEVKPALEVRAADATSPTCASVTKPDSKSRDAIRLRVRLACLLASLGAVELPVSFFQGDLKSPFAAGKGNQVGRPISNFPFATFPVDVDRVKSAFVKLASFQQPDSLERAIDRLGRARLTGITVDTALELGIAAEIALMHDQSSGNTEISHKIGGRAAWLLGTNAADRANIFAEMKLLYKARSQAVHSGTLSAKSKVDLDAGDALVARSLIAILERGQFPDWSSLTLGGDG